MCRSGVLTESRHPSTEVFSVQVRRRSDRDDRPHCRNTAALPANSPASMVDRHCIHEKMRAPGTMEQPWAGRIRNFREEPRMRVHRCSTRSEEHTSELQSLMRNSYAVVSLKTKNTITKQ